MTEVAVEAKNHTVKQSRKEIVVETKNLEKIYDGKVHAVCGVNFELFDGEVLGF